MQPFPVRVSAGSLDTDKASIDPLIVEQQVQAQLETLMLASPFQNFEEVLSSMLLELKAKLLKQVMKIDILGQV